jgi:NitT/TauT family transport system permease protein
LLAAAVGIPLGILCGCFNWFNAFLLPLTLFGRNIPIVALVPLMFNFFGATEMAKVMFIFVAAVAFVIIDAATAIRDVDNRYIDTAYTLGASRRQIVRKVLVPLAMPSIFNSLRLLFGLAFGYIMLAEAIKFGNEAGGLGNIILISQRLNKKEPIYLILLIIPLVALAIDRVLYWIQRQLFPHQYGSDGLLHSLVRAITHGLEDLKALVISPKKLEATQAALPSPGGKR